jgi:tight adherence protein C
MNPLEMVSLAALGAGSALTLQGIRWFRTVPIAERLRPYLPAAGPASPGRSATAASVLTPLVVATTSRLSRVLGDGTDLARRLEQAGHTVDPAAFRLRQVTHALIGLGAGAVLSLAISPGLVAGVVLVLGAPVLAVLADEQRLVGAVATRRQRLELELPVVAEQLAILIDAGLSLPSALARIGRRGDGIVADDLTAVGRRIRQGLSVSDALGEWSGRRDLDSVRRLVGVLSLHRDAGDLGRLVAGEARAMRSEAHRALIERIERRSQLVWIPVTVATLVPGLLFLAVPFVSALSRVTGT